MKRELGPLIIGISPEGFMNIDKGIGVFANLSCIGPLYKNYPENDGKCNVCCPHVKLFSTTKTDSEGKETKIYNFIGCEFNYSTTEMIDYENKEEIEEYQKKQKEKNNPYEILEEQCKCKKKSWWQIFCGNSNDTGPGSPIH